MGSRGVLIVEREGAFRRSLVGAVEALGYPLRTAGRWAQALEVLASWPCSLAIVDPTLTGLPGDAVVIQIRVISRDAGLPIFFLSNGDLSSAEVRQAMRAGVLGALQRNAPVAEAVYRVHAQLAGPGPTRFSGAPRVDVRTPVRFSSTGSEEARAGIAHNLSRTGMLVNTSSAAPLGARLQLSFQLPRAARTIECEGRVARVVAPGDASARGLGVAFRGLRSGDQHALARFVLGRLTRDLAQHHT